MTDFSQFDNRTAPEAGAEIQLLHPMTQEPIEGAFVIVRGEDTKIVVEAYRKLRAAARKKNTPREDDVLAVHEESVKFAAPCIIGFVGVERDKRALTGSPDDVAWFLNRIVPRLETREVEEEQPVLDRAGEPMVDEDGEAMVRMVKVKRRIMVNLPFTHQVVNASADYSNFLQNDAEA